MSRPSTVDAPLPEHLKTLRDLLRAARDERLIRCEHLDVYERRSEVPESIRDQLPESADELELHYAVAWRLDRFAAIPFTGQLARHAASPASVAQIIAGDLDRELNDGAGPAAA